MNIAFEAANIFGSRVELCSKEEMKIYHAAGENTLVYEVDWQSRKVIPLLKTKNRQGGTHN
jgi:hypothetical protein